jgi:GNAT superfamily N-acetyltransferase
VKPVIQEETTGCGIASVANILGKTYPEMKKIANEMGIYATDKSLWSDTHHVRRILSAFGAETSKVELPFTSWDNLPDLALLPIKHHEEHGQNFWHWTVFKRENGKACVLDSASYLPENVRTDFDAMFPKWFIEVNLRNKPISQVLIDRATVDDSQEIAVMVGELLAEIMNTIGVHAFNFDLDETTDRLKDFFNREKYFVFVARDDANTPVGFVALYESYALYAEGAFGTIPELYVRPAYRSNNLGFRLISQAKTFGLSRGWKRLEVTTPPLPQFDKTLEFYEREGFTITGGRKLKVAL